MIGFGAALLLGQIGVNGTSSLFNNKWIYYAGVLIDKRCMLMSNRTDKAAVQGGSRATGNRIFVSQF